MHDEAEPPDPTLPTLPAVPRANRLPPGRTPATYAGDDANTAHAARPTGSQFAERFRVGGELGRGGLGVVLAARDTAIDRDVAIKLVLAPENRVALARFVEEGRITGQLEHPNIVPVYELARDPDQPYLAMRLVRGRTLQEIIRAAKARGRRSGWADLQRDGRLDMFLKVCDAIAYAHSRGVIHRDLKPANVMVGEFGEVMVMDWGLAKLIGADNKAPTVAGMSGGSGERRHLPSGRRLASTPLTTPTPGSSGSPPTAPNTMDGDIVGTPAFMPPEQARGEVDQLDERADIFALGAMLYSLLTFEPPYRADGPLQVLVKAAQRNLESPLRRAPSQRIPRDLDAIVMKAMSAEPARRYRRVTDLADDIRAASAFEPISARRLPLWSRLVRMARRHPVVLMVASVLMVAAGVVVAVLAEASAAQARTEQHRASAEQRARDERLRALAAEERFDELRRELTGAALRTRDAVRQEMMDLYEHRPPGISDEQFVRGLGEGDVQRFVQAFERVIQVGHAADDALITWLDYFYLGLLQSAALGDRELAIRTYTAGIDLAPRESSLYFNRALNRQALGDTDGALADLARAIELAPKSHLAWIGRGVLYEQRGRDDLARADFTRAIELAPTFAQGWFMRASLLIRAKEHALARRDLDTVLRLEPRMATALANRAICEIQLGDTDAAMRDLDDAVAIDPQLANAWNIRSRLHDRLGNFTAALSDITRAVEINPQSAEWHFR
ncbi:MAG: tetratricopeptide repeat protein, partial [Planctomycetota bacterium]